MSERLTSISISTTTLPATRLSTPSISPGFGGSRISNFSFKDFSPIAVKPSALKIDTPKPDFLKMPKLEAVKAPSLDQKGSKDAVLGSKILWQAPKPEAKPEIKPKTEAPKIQAAEIAKPKVVAQTLTKEITTQPSLNTLKKDAEQMAKNIGLPKPKEQPELSPDLKQALKTHEILSAAFAKTLKPEQARTQAEIVLCKAITQPQLKEQFLTLVKTELTVRTRKTTERRVKRLIFAVDEAANQKRIEETLSIADQLKKEGKDEAAPILGYEVAKRTTHPDPENQRSGILKLARLNILDGSRQVYMSLIANFRGTISELKVFAKKAARRSPAVTITEESTTETATVEDRDRVYRGESEHYYIESLLRRSTTTNLVLYPAGKT